MKCDRCGRETTGTTMSWFNTEIICLDVCDPEERAHPMFEEARRIETEHTLNGDTHFPGIGLPPDLMKGERA